MPYLPKFPEPGSYIRYYDATEKVVKYRRLTWRREPFRYPFRMPQVSAATDGSETTFLELNPSETKKHIYLAYLGVSPGFRFQLFHPFGIRTLKWDERITVNDENLTGNITYEESPYEFPTKAIGIEHDRYPGLIARNVSGATRTPEVVFLASLYLVKEHKDLSPEELSKLDAGVIRSHPWDFGGEI